MSENYFFYRLDEYVRDSDLTHTQLVERLKKYDQKLFSGLDANTFSRWMRGKTKPNFFKQINIFIALGIDISPLINLNDAKCVKKETDVCETFFRNLDRYLSGYSGLIKSTIIHENVKLGEYAEKYQYMYYINSAGIRLFSNSCEENNEKTITLMKIDEQGKSHISYLDQIDNATTNWLGIDDKYIGTIVIFPIFYANSFEAKLLMSSLIRQIINIGRLYFNRKLLIFVTNYHTAKFYEDLFGANLIKFYRKTSNAFEIDNGMMLYEIDITKVLSVNYMIQLLKTE